MELLTLEFSELDIFSRLLLGRTRVRGLLGFVIYIIFVELSGSHVQANLKAVNLSVSSMYIPDFVSMSYLNYGAAVSEARPLQHLLLC